jgi:large subunit ribosomal protein L25
MQEVTLEIEKREQAGKGASRRLRAAGRVPAVVYGGGKETVVVEVNRKTLADTLKKGSGENTIFLLKLGDTGKSRHAMIRDLQVDPLTRQILHVDFQRILMSEKVRVQVPIELQGLAYGVKNEGAVLDFVTRHLTLECLPAEIPAHLTLDVSDLHVNRHLEAKDVALPPGVALVGEGERVIVSCRHTKAEEAKEAPAEGAELLEAAPTEPEVIKRGKATDEEDAAEAPEKADKKADKKSEKKADKKSEKKPEKK